MRAKGHRAVLDLNLKTIGTQPSHISCNQKCIEISNWKPNKIFLLLFLINCRAAYECECMKMGFLYIAWISLVLVVCFGGNVSAARVNVEPGKHCIDVQNPTGKHNKYQRQIQSRLSSGRH